MLVSSEAHAWASYSAPQEDDIFGNLGSKDSEYYLAKLFLILFGRELASRLDQARIVAVMTTPGFCASSLFRDSDGFLASIVNAVSARSAEYGGRLHLHAATAPASEAHGRYYRDGRLTKFVLAFVINAIRHH